MTNNSSTDQKNEIDPRVDHPKNRSLVNKRFKHYFFEFILVFMAVFFGFLAETYREYLAERSKEKVYIKGLIQNLKDDIEQLNDVISVNAEKLKYLDSIQQLRKRISSEPGFNKALSRVIVRGIYKGTFFKSNNAILTEMKASSGLILLPREVIDSISMYERNLYLLEKEEVQYEHHGLQTIEFYITLTEDWGEWVSPIEADKKELRHLFNSCANIGSSVNYYNALLAKQKSKAFRLVSFLKDRYRIQD